ncbi:MAG: response regulator transcription factor [Pseudomonadota bacterium]
MSALRVLVIDDHWIARAAVISLLPQLSSEPAVFEASSAEDAMKVIEGEDKLDLIILDLNLPDADPWSTIQTIRDKASGVPVVVMSVSERREDVLKCLEQGVVGYLPKTSEPEHIVATIRRVLAGEVALPQRLLLNRTSSEATAITDDTDFLRVCTIIENFTPRQKEVFEFLADGATNIEIATALGLSVNTVRVHMQTIGAKLDVRQRSAIGAYAARWRSRTEGSSSQG